MFVKFVCVLCVNARNCSLASCVAPRACACVVWVALVMARQVSSNPKDGRRARPQHQKQRAEVDELTAAQRTMEGKMARMANHIRDLQVPGGGDWHKG